MKPLNPGEAWQVGRYRLLASLGEGGMGRVLLGASPDGRLVALKQVHPGFAHDEGFRSRFRREVETSRMVSGAYTAAVMDADPDAEIPWLASVYVPGPSLKEAVDAAGPLPLESIRYLATGLASALTEIHRAGLIHRDLKPSNVLLTDDGPRVIDFGIARAAEGNNDLTHTGSVIGSPGFMSPEQAEGKSLTPASDMFSLGALLVMAATGQSPFAGNSTPQTLYNVVHTHPNLTTLPPPVRQLAEPCLAKDPAHRPTPAQLLDHLGAVRYASMPWPPPVHARIAHHKEEVGHFLAKPPPPPAKPSAGNKRKRVLITAGAIVATLILAGGTVFAVSKLTGDSTHTANRPPRNPDPLSLDRLRLVDACKVLDPNALPVFGKTTVSENDGFGTCDYTIPAGGKVALNLGDSIGGDPLPRTSYIGDIPTREMKYTEQDLPACKHTAQPPDRKSPAVGVNVQSKSGDICKAAQEILVAAMGSLKRNPVELSLAEDSVLPLDPCTLMDPATPPQLLPGKLKTELSNIHTCEWSTDDGRLSVSAYGGKKSDDAPNETVKIDDIEVHQKKYEFDSGASCHVDWPHAEINSANDEYVQVEILPYSDKNKSADICGMAQRAAKSVLTKAPVKE
ncbi:serine/threonine-protein kinase [Amycolatopsis minnesotensis]|uniref:Protein kinase domain-containing protein n=1 Tax=Amycolatopsis minnesotensis TaxID=337894 RepID=A0ABN2SE99_9PSEU